MLYYSLAGKAKNLYAEVGCVQGAFRECKTIVAFCYCAGGKKIEIFIRGTVMQRRLDTHIQMKLNL